MYLTHGLFVICVLINDLCDKRWFIIFNTNKNPQYYWELALSPSFLSFFLGNNHKANFEKERHSDNRDKPAPVLERINFDKRAIPESYCTWNAAAILLTKLEHQRRSLSKENAIEPSANSSLNILLELGVKHLTLKITNSFNESYKSTYS